MHSETNVPASSASCPPSQTRPSRPPSRCTPPSNSSRSEARSRPGFAPSSLSALPSLASSSTMSPLSRSTFNPNFWPPSSKKLLPHKRPSDCALSLSRRKRSVRRMSSRQRVKPRLLRSSVRRCPRPANPTLPCKRLIRRKQSQRHSRVTGMSRTCLRRTRGC